MQMQFLDPVSKRMIETLQNMTDAQMAEQLSKWAKKLEKQTKKLPKRKIRRGIGSY